MSAALTATKAAERLPGLDLWRGFALLGVCLANFVHDNQEFLSAERIASFATHGFDWRVNRLLTLLVSNNFNTIFTFLFGISFAILIERARKAERAPEQVLMRRMAILLCFGIVHLLLLNSGELLHVYAVCGFALLLLRNVSNRTLLIAGLFLALVPRVLQEELDFFDLGGLPAIPADERYAILHDGTWWEVMRANAAAALQAFTDVDRKIGQAVYFFGRMLLGFWFWRSGLCRKLFEVETGRVFRWFLATAVAGAILMAISFLGAGETGTARHFVMTEIRHIRFLVIAATYLLGLTLLVRFASARWIVTPLRAVGRMSLSNYLLQSVAMFLILYGPVLRLGGEIGTTFAAGIALVVYVVLVVFSYLWLLRFEQGPAELLWRRLTYGSRRDQR